MNADRRDPGTTPTRGMPREWACRLS